MAEKPTLLGGWVAMAAFLHRPAAAVRLHFEVAALDIQHRVARFEGDLASGERQDKIRHPEVSTCATHIHPLLVPGEERTVEAAGDSFREKEFGREFCRHRQLAARVLELREDSAGHPLRKPPVHGPEGKSDAIPTEITQASIRLQIALRSNIGDEEILQGTERKCRGNPPDGANGLAVIEHFPDSLQAAAVHEHDVIHELDLVSLASLQHFNQLNHTGGAGFFADDVFAGLGGALDPLPTDSGGQRDVNGIDIGGRQQFLITAQSTWDGLKGGLGLTFIDETPAALEVPAGYGGNAAVLGVPDGLPVLPGDVGSTQNAPAENWKAI